MLSLLTAIAILPMPQETAMIEVKGTFAVAMTPVAQDFPAQMKLEKTYTGPLQGTATGLMMAHRTQIQGSAGYVAMEHFIGKLDDKEGGFVLQHSGLMDQGTPQLTVTIIPDSGTGDLAGIRGEMDIDIKDGQHFYTLRYRFD